MCVLLVDGSDGDVVPIKIIIKVKMVVQSLLMAVMTECDKPVLCHIMYR